MTNQGGIKMNKFFIITLICFLTHGVGTPKLFAATWSQPPSGWGGFLSSANFHAWSADDFKFNDSTAIERVDWWSEGDIADMPIAYGFYIRFYDNYYNADTGQSMAGSMLYEIFVTGDAHQSQDGYYCHYYVELSPDSFVANGGQPYWVSIQGDFTNDPNGDHWWGWAKSNTRNRNPAEYNSRNYSHHPINESPFYGGNYDLAFELQGSPVPIPGAVWLMGSGLIGLAGLKSKSRKSTK